MMYLKKDLGLIQPPHMPNIKFSRFSLTNELVCWGSFGIDPDNFSVANPTFYLHKSQIKLYCDQAGQHMESIYFPYPSPVEQQKEPQTSWEKDISQPPLDFLSNLGKHQIYTEVQDEMFIDLSSPENEEESDLDKDKLGLSWAKLSYCWGC